MYIISNDFNSVQTQRSLLKVWSVFVFLFRVCIIYIEGGRDAGVIKRNMNKNEIITLSVNILHMDKCWSVCSSRRSDSAA